MSNIKAEDSKEIKLEEVQATAQDKTPAEEPANAGGHIQDPVIKITEDKTPPKVTKQSPKKQRKATTFKIEEDNAPCDYSYKMALDDLLDHNSLKVLVATFGIYMIVEGCPPVRCMSFQMCFKNHKALDTFRKEFKVGKVERGFTAWKE